MELQYQPSESVRYYRPAYAFNWKRAILGGVLVLLGIIATAVLFWWVSSWDLFSKYIIPRVALEFVPGAALAGILYWYFSAAQFGKVWAAITFATVAGMLMLAVAWILWAFTFIKLLGFPIPMGDYLRNLNLVPEIVKLGYESGTWVYDGKPVRAVPISICWVIEAILFLVPGIYVAAKLDRPPIYCAKCRRACKQFTGLGRFNGQDTTGVAEQIVSGNYDYLLTLGPVKDEDAPEVGLELWVCPNCSETNVLLVNEIELRALNNGAVLSSRPIVDRLLISIEQVKHIAGLKARLEAQDDSSREKSESN